MSLTSSKQKMFNLPFNVPEEELELNLMLLLILISELSTTARGKNILDNDRLQINFYLAQNPHTLNKLLLLLSKKQVHLKSYELASFKAEKTNIDSLYDLTALKDYLKILITKELVSVIHSEEIGFVYTPTGKSKILLKNLKAKYFNRIYVFIDGLKQIRSIPTSKIKNNIKIILSKG